MAYPLPTRTLSNTATDHLADHNSIHPKLNDIPNVMRDYGAKGDGVTNDAPAFNNLIAALPSTSNATSPTGGMFYVPPGRYIIGTPGITVPSTTQVWMLGSNFASTGHSANKVACQLISPSGATWPVITMGESTGSAAWYGSKIENISFRDAGGNGVGGIQWWNSCMGQVVNCDFQNFQAGFGVATGPMASANPQYTKIMFCRSESCKYGVYAYGADTEVIHCDLHGVNATGSAVAIIGSIGVDCQGGCHIVGGSIQDWETGVRFQGAAGKIYGTALENSSGTGENYGIRVMGTASLTYIAGIDIVNTYQVGGIVLEAGATLTTIVGSGGNISGFSGLGSQIIDNSGDGTNVVFDAKYGMRPRRATTSSRNSFATSIPQGTEMYDTTLNKPIWKDGAGNWRDAAGNIV